MASWERQHYALPGDHHQLLTGATLTRPFFYAPASHKNAFDDPRVDEALTIKSSDVIVFVVAAFIDHPKRGAIVLVHDRGLWWWDWN